MAITQKFAIYEEDTATGIGHLTAVDAATASGIAVPAFRPVTGLPPTANQVGEAIIDTNTHLSYVWDGLNWIPVVPPAIVSFPTDADVLNATAATAGTFAWSVATGNLWLRHQPTGGGALEWRPVGVRVYPTQAGLLASTPSDGTLATATDTKAFFVRTGGAWVSSSWVYDTDAHIRAKTSFAGQVAFASDSHKLYFGTAAGAWATIPWKEYATEAALLADAQPNGTMAVALDSGHVAYRVNNAWTIINASVPSSTPIGTIEQSILTAVQFETALSAAEKGKWALMDGRDITGTDLATVTGNNKLPDLRGAFLRMAGTNASNAAWVGGTLGGFQEDTTARPDTAFTTNNTGNHKHRHGKKEFGPQDELWAYGYDHNKLGTGWVTNNEDGHNQYLGFTETTGQHSHSIDGGGDTETRPKNFSVSYFIKITK